MHNIVLFYNIKAYRLQRSLFTCLHTKKINDKPLVGKTYRLKSKSGARGKKHWIDGWFLRQIAQKPMHFHDVFTCWVSIECT